MNRFQLAVACMVTAATLGGQAQDAVSPDPYANETKEQRDARMQWWREARFGLFIHWGVYAVPAGTYKGQQVGGIGEWIMNRGKIPLAEYREYPKQFACAKYDPDKWVETAKKAGMKYIVITSKHHDGFTLYPSAATNWGISQSPHGKDLLRPLADACRKHGLKLGFYYSQAQDWNNGGAGNGWDPANQRDMDEYIDKVAVPQVKEILTGYGEFPAVLWWDTPANMNKERAEKLIALLKLKPGIIHNNRLGGGYKGDTETPEQHIPAMGYKDRDWETCMTMNNTWGYKSYDDAWKPVETLIRNLCDIASKGGNYLLNVGPTAEGEIPQPSIDRLLEVGKWMDVNGAAIYGTTATPFSKLAWGRCTKKMTDNGGALFFHVFDWPKDGKLLIPGLKTRLTGAKLLAGGAKLETEQTADGVVIKVPATAPDAIASVIQAEFTGALDVARVLPTADAKGVITLDMLSVDIHNHLGSEAKIEGDHIGYWISDKAYVTWTCKVPAAGTYSVRADCATTKDSKFTVSCGGKKIDAIVENTTDYKKFRTFTLGALELAAGEQTVKIEPVKGGWSPINLRSLVLTPVR